MVLHVHWRVRWWRCRVSFTTSSSVLIHKEVASVRVTGVINSWICWRPLVDVSIVPQPALSAFIRPLHRVRDVYGRRVLWPITTAKISPFSPPCHKVIHYAPVARSIHVNDVLVYCCHVRTLVTCYEFLQRVALHASVVLTTANASVCLSVTRWRCI